MYFFYSVIIFDFISSEKIEICFQFYTLMMKIIAFDIF